MIFDTAFEKIIDRVHQIDPIAYAHSRNDVQGAVTYLSPYISRGVISTKEILESLMKKGFEPHQIEKLVQEMAWREYWQQLWIVYQTRIDEDLKRAQQNIVNHGIPSALVNHQTAIEAIDKGIFDLYESGYMHNHVRMYVASLACNVAKCHWKIPAQWMYYHLLDADWASNALSWQWVCGANSNKLYYANQENINRYGHTKQTGTFLDMPYESFSQMSVPDVLLDVIVPEWITPLPPTSVPTIAPNLPTLVYNFYQIDPQWRNQMEANRILLLEPSVFKKYPVSQKSIEFCIALALDNIPGIQVWVAEFAELKSHATVDIYFKEHPLNNHYKGKEEARTWMTKVTGEYPSFFAYWKKCKKELF